MQHYRLPEISDRPETVILANGAYPSSPLSLALLATAGKVVCCDGATDAYVARGGVPYAIVGDCDSLAPETISRYADRIFRTTEQDSNDLTKAVMYCAENGLTDLTILGATGKREDHTLGNISLLADYTLRTSARIVTDYGIFDAIRSAAVFESRPGQQVSLFTIGAGASISAKGLLYPLPPEGLRSWWCGTLNEATDTTFTIHTNSPTLVFRELV